MGNRLIGVENELHHEVLKHISFGLKAKCWFCKIPKRYRNPIIIWNREDIIKLCPNCSVHYINKDFTKLLELLISDEVRT